MATSTNKTAAFGVKPIHKFNGDRYRAIITNFFIPELNNHDVQELWFQQDGATCHTARATIDLLKDTFIDRLISRFGPVNWPPRSCDLTPLDYFLWGYVKSLVYADKLQTLDHLEDNIRHVIVDIRPQMLEKVIENWTSRLDYIRASRGSPMPEIIFKIKCHKVLPLSPEPQILQKNEKHKTAAIGCSRSPGQRDRPQICPDPVGPNCREQIRRGPGEFPKYSLIERRLIVRRKSHSEAIGCNRWGPPFDVVQQLGGGLPAQVSYLFQFIRSITNSPRVVLSGISFTETTITILVMRHRSSETLTKTRTKLALFSPIFYIALT
ncbi:uncharacterized protein TNCV_738121 [Trichonephila clavipes]|nr:uncharacterized protein TNCV_738121 [Trichonephila clavipes]